MVKHGDGYEGLRDSPLLAAFTALLLVIFSITLAVSCGEEKGTTNGEQDTSARTATGRTTTKTTAAQPSTTSTTPPMGVYSRSSSTVWASVFSRKDPFIQKIGTEEEGPGTTTIPTAGATTPTSYYGDTTTGNGTTGYTTTGDPGTTGTTTPSTGGTGYTYPPAK